MKCKGFDKTRLPREKKGFLNSIKGRKLCDDDKSYGCSASFATPMGCLWSHKSKKKPHKQISNFLMNFPFLESMKIENLPSNIQHLWTAGFTSMVEVLSLTNKSLGHSFSTSTLKYWIKVHVRFQMCFHHLCQSSFADFIELPWVWQSSQERLFRLYSQWYFKVPNKYTPTIPNSFDKNNIFLLPAA